MLLGLIAACFFICILKDVKRAVWIGFTVAAAQLILHLQIKFGSDSRVFPLEIALVTALLAMVALSILRRQKWPLFGALFWGACYIICHGLGSIVYAAAWQQIVMQAALYVVFGGLLILQQLYCVRLCLKDAQEPASFLAAPRPELSWQKSSDQEMQRLLIFAIIWTWWRRFMMRAKRRKRGRTSRTPSKRASADMATACVVRRSFRTC